MATLFLVVIYLAFISLGLPDSLLGVAWPDMRSEYGLPLATAGWLSMTMAGGTILSSLFSGVVIRRFGTGKVTLISCLMTASALMGFYVAPSLGWLWLCTIPLGLGAGAIDAGLNNYVALHYKAQHMSWLHCFWGVGATLGPIIMAQYLSGSDTWREGYFAIAGVQFALVVILLITLPLWNQVAARTQRAAELASTSESQTDPFKNTKPLHIRGVKFALISFLFYCAAEATVGLWGSSYLVQVKGLSEGVAARWISLYFAGITVGRLITGFLMLKFNNNTLIRAGQWMAVVGGLLLLFPLGNLFFLFGLIVIGLGLAPIFPSMLHETPVRFGKTHSQSIIGYQMASAYIGVTFMPPLVGYISSQTSIKVYPYLVILFLLVMLLASEMLNRTILRRITLNIDNVRIDEKLVEKM